MSDEEPVAITPEMVDSWNDGNDGILIPSGTYRMPLPIAFSDGRIAREVWLSPGVGFVAP